ncbi:hypothetical protein BH10PSE14_BH10PSE14_04200 [soil metagenome]
MSFITALSGYKTYLTAAATALAAVAAVASGQMTLAQGGVAIGAMLTATFLRSGSKADAIKASVLAAAHAADALGPVVVKLLPQTKTVADIVERISAEVEAALAPPVDAPAAEEVAPGVS